MLEPAAMSAGSPTRQSELATGQLPAAPALSIELFRVAGGVLAIRVGAVISTLLFTSVLSFRMNAADYGALATVLSLVLFASAFGEFGQRELMAREIAGHLARGDEAGARHIARHSTMLATGAGLVSAVVTAVWLRADGSNWVVALAGAAMTAILSVNGSWSGTGRARGQFFWALAPREILWRSLAVAGVVLAGWMGIHTDATSGVLWLLVALAVSAALQVLMLGTEHVIAFDAGSTVRQPAIARGFLRASRDIAVFNIGGLILVTMDVVAVGMLLGNRAAAEYFPANRIALLSFSVFITLQLALGPRFAHEASLGRMEAVHRLGKLAARFAVLAAVAACVVVYFTRPLFPILFHTATDQTWVVTEILCLGFTVNAALGFSGVVLVATGHEADVRRIMMWSAPLSAIGLYLAALGGREMGVALMVVAATSARVLAEAVMCHRRLGFIPAPGP